MMNKLIGNLFTFSLITFVILGSLSVFFQIYGLFTGNGAFMLWADGTFFQYAVIGSSIAAFLSFLYPYTNKRKNNYKVDKSKDTE